MTKRGQPTGLPKDKKGTTPTPTAKDGKSQPRLIREYRSSKEREQELQRLLLLGVGIAGGIAVLIFVVAFVIDQLIVPRQEVARVNDEVITVAEFESRVRLERALLIEQINDGYQLYAAFYGGQGATPEQVLNAVLQQPPYSTWYNELQVSDQLGNRVLNQMIDDELVRQQAAALGITVSPEEIDAKIHEFFSYDPETAGQEPTATPEPTITPTLYVSPTPTNTPTLTPTPETTDEVALTPTSTPEATGTPVPTLDATQVTENFNTTRNGYFSNITSSARISEADIRAYFEISALREKLRDQVASEVGETAPFTNLRLITVASEELANDVIAALNAGDSFNALAQSVSTDASNTAGGSLGWLTSTSIESTYSEAVATAVAEAPVGTVLAPIQNGAVWYVIEVSGREDREMTETDIEQAQNVILNDYIEEVRDAETTNVEIYDIWTDNVPEIPRFTIRV